MIQICRKAVQTPIILAEDEFFEEMQSTPTKSEVNSFRKFSERMMSIQRQLDATYHDDKYLLDRLLTAMDIPKIQKYLRDRVPRSSYQLINRVANRLSEITKTAGINSISLADTRNNTTNEHDVEIYTLG